MKEMYINLAIIAAFIIFSQISLKWQRYPLQETKTKIMIYIFTIILIVLCMTVSISENEVFIFDMRVIPYMIGSLYGGPIVSLALYVSMIVWRMIIGIDAGLLAAMIHYALLGVFLSAVSSRFIQATINKRLVMIMIIIGLHMLLSQLLLFSLFKADLSALLFWQTSFIKLATVITFVLIADMIDRYHKVRIQLDELEKMEMVYHLSASVTHEVRNGLTSAHGFLQLLQESEPDPTRREYIRISLDELNRTELIIHDFLTFAKPVSKHNKAFDLSNTINNTVLLIEPLAKMHSITIKKHLQSVEIIGDETMLQQAFLNIFKNAIEAMSNSGLLEITMHVHTDGTYIYIKDTGIGMSLEQIQQLGKPYYTTKGQKGTGLGMLVTYRAIQRLNGKIEIESTVDKGTTFTIYLPISNPLL